MLKQLDKHDPQILVYMPESFASYTREDQQIVAHDFLNPGFGVRRSFDLMVRFDEHDSHVWFNHVRHREICKQIGADREKRIANRNASVLRHAEIPFERCVRAWGPFSDDFRHKCPDWDFLPITLRDSEAVGCSCYRGTPSADALYAERERELDEHNERNG